MANGWGGRRKGAGAPSGNNNRVVHGEYSKMPLPTACEGGEELTDITLSRAQIIYCLIEQQSLEDVKASIPWAQREYARFDGLIGQRIDQVIRFYRKSHYTNQRNQLELYQVRIYAERKTTNCAG